jgi:hypothetical protein
MGTSNSAAKHAQQADAARQEQIKQSIGQITAAYSSPQRQAQYDAYGANLKNYYTNQVNEQEATNARNLKFSMARNGLTGGSVAVDSNTQLQKDYAKGLIQAAQQASAGKASLQQSDINAKNSLVSLAQQGAYTGAIPAQVNEAQLATSGAAQNYGSANSLGNLFSNTGKVYENMTLAAANRKAQMNPIGSPYGTGSASVFGK